jgi:hypothetical protein
MAERDTPTGEAELRRALREKDEEVRRLRDLLVAKDLEMGVVEGRLAELEDRAERLAAIPVAGRLVRPAMKLLRGRS